MLSKLLEQSREVVVDALFPRRCGLCERVGVHGICIHCVNRFENSEMMARVLAKQPLDWYAATYKFASMATPIHLLKYDRDTSVTDSLSQLLWEHAQTLAIPADTTFVPIPIHWRRKAWRGYNQADNLVRSFPQDRVAFDWIERVRHTTPQAGQSMEFRQANLQGAFRANYEKVSGRRILLIDDVFTSGATGRECARALKLAGASEVALLCLTHA